MTEPHRLHADAVVVGAGLGGLGAAGYLAREGYRVVVLEHHTVPGGYAHEFKRRGFRFDVALHALDGAGAGGWLNTMLDDLGVLDRVAFTRLDPFYTARFPDYEITVSADPGEYVRRLKADFPNEAEHLDALFAATRRVAEDVGAYTRARAGGRRPAPMEMVGRYPDMAAAFSTDWGSFLARHIADRRLRAVVSALWGYLGLPPSKVSAGLFALVIDSYANAGAWYPVGGSQAMSRAIVDGIVEHGGTVRFRDRVARIEMREGRAGAVETERGLRVDARVVVSNASPAATVDLAGREHFDPAYLANVDTDVPAMSNLVVYLGLDRDLAAEGWDHHEFFLSEGYDIEADYAAVSAGDFSKAGMVIANYTKSDPGCAPAGKSVLVLMSLAPWGHADVWGTGGDLVDYSGNPRYVQVKRTAADHLIDRAERLIPGLRNSIIVEEIGTPLTNVRYGLNPAGSIYGREQTVGNMMNRRSPKTPIPNLLLAGAWVGGGGMSAALNSGRTAATIARGLLASGSA